MIKDLVKKIHSFFANNVGKNCNNIMDFCKTLPNFVLSKSPEGGETCNMSLLMEVDTICRKMVDECLLIQVRKDPVVVMNNAYCSIGQSQLQEEIDYGTFDFMLQGFQYSYEHFKHSVVMITGHTPKEDVTNGTAFYVGKSMFVTAKHCVSDLEDFKIIDINEVVYPITKVIYPNDETLDLALIIVGNKTIGMNALRIDVPCILDDVITIGFPPIPGFTSFQVAEKAQVSSMQIVSKGANVGEGFEYLLRKDHFLISARVKGGNSGSPVINKRGKVVGVLVNLATDGIDQTKADIMGYGICLPSRNITTMLQSGNYVILDVEINEDNYYKIHS